MTWTNAFDAGECTVKVTSFNGASVDTLYSGVMAKGGSQDFTAFESTFTVAVSSEGVASLNGPQFGGSGGNVALLVEPSYSGASAARINEMTVDVGLYGSTNVVAFASLEDGPFTNLSGSGSAWTPDPVDFDTFTLLAIGANGVTA